jgi:hypothetical protein
MPRIAFLHARCLVSRQTGQVVLRGSIGVTVSCDVRIDFFARPAMSLSLRGQRPSLLPRTALFWRKPGKAAAANHIRQFEFLAMHLLLRVAEKWGSHLLNGSVRLPQKNSSGGTPSARGTIDARRTRFFAA